MLLGTRFCVWVVASALCSERAHVCVELLDPDDEHKLAYAYQQVQGDDSWRGTADVHPTVRQAWDFLYHSVATLLGVLWQAIMWCAAQHILRVKFGNGGRTS